MKKLLNFYDKQYKKILIIPLVLLILAIAQIGYQVATTGHFIERDYSLKGGTEITIQTDYKEIASLKQELQEKFKGIDDVRALSQTGQTSGLIITHTNENNEPILNYLKEKLQLEQEQISINTIGSALAQDFFKQVFIAMGVAFIFMALVVFYYFRIPIPSLAVILAAVSDILITLAVVNVMGMKLSTAGIAAFLMLIGYSVDTDILLSTKVLKRTEGTVQDRIISAMKTGLTMTATTLVAITAALIITQSPIIKQIMTILLIGLLIDLINTWIQNAGILKWYMEKKNVQTN